MSWAPATIELINIKDIAWRKMLSHQSRDILIQFVQKLETSVLFNCFSNMLLTAVWVGSQQGAVTKEKHGRENTRHVFLQKKLNYFWINEPLKSLQCCTSGPGSWHLFVNILSNLHLVTHQSHYGTSCHLPSCLYQTHASLPSSLLAPPLPTLDELDEL